MSSKETQMTQTPYGANIAFICNYLFENPGASFTQVRNALCIARGIDPVARRGQFCVYFVKPNESASGRSFSRSGKYWDKRGKEYYLTELGLARVRLA